MLEPKAQIEFARQVLRAESDAILGLMPLVDEHFISLVELILSNEGCVIVCGLGKSGIIGRKISATLASTGTPSHFLHPTEALHGDLGRVTGRDVLFLLSYSGQTDEIIRVAEHACRNNIPVISLTGDCNSTLAKLSVAGLSIGNLPEACTLRLAPTTSTAAMLAMGDAIALTASRCRKFTEQEFHRYHPGGQLGKLSETVGSFIRNTDIRQIPLVADDLTVESVLKALPLTVRRGGAILLVNDKGRLTGIFTDADLRRLIAKDGIASVDSIIRDRMSREPKTLKETDLLRDAAEIMIRTKIDEIPVVNARNEPIGIIDVQDLLLLGIKVRQDKQGASSS